MQMLRPGKAPDGALLCWRRGQDSNLRGPKPDRWSPLGRFGYLSLVLLCLGAASVTGSFKTSCTGVVKSAGHRHQRLVSPVST